MHPDFKAILAYLQRKRSTHHNFQRHSVAVLEDNELYAFHDIEFSLDYAPSRTGVQRGMAIGLIHQQAERCLGYVYL